MDQPVNQAKAVQTVYSNNNDLSTCFTMRNALPFPANRI